MFWMIHGMKPFASTLLPTINNTFSLWDFFKSSVLLSLIAEYRTFLKIVLILPIPTCMYEIFDINCRKIEQISRDSSFAYETESQNIVYMQKFLLGGVLLYELHFCEPFFNAKLYALEYTRLNTKSNVLVSQVTIFSRFFFPFFFF